MNYKYAIGSYVEYSYYSERPPLNSHIGKIIECRNLTGITQAYIIDGSFTILESEIIRELSTDEAMIYLLEK